MVHLSNGRHCIEVNGKRSKSCDYPELSFWPDDEQVELIGRTSYWGKEEIYVVKNRLAAQDWVSVNESTTEARTQGGNLSPAEQSYYDQKQ